MSCHPKHIELEPLELPPIERRPLLLEAGRLRAEGLSLRQIGEKMDCSHTTAAKLLREFEQHRFQLLQVVAVDQLLNSILKIVASTEDEESIPVRDRLHAARELRLLLADLPQLADYDEKQRHAASEYLSRAQAWEEYAEYERQQQQEQQQNGQLPVPLDPNGGGTVPQGWNG